MHFIDLHSNQAHAWVLCPGKEVYKREAAKLPGRAFLAPRGVTAMSHTLAKAKVVSIYGRRLGLSSGRLRRMPTGDLVKRPKLVVQQCNKVLALPVAPKHRRQRRVVNFRFLQKQLPAPLAWQCHQIGAAVPMYIDDAIRGAMAASCECLPVPLDHPKML